MIFKFSESFVSELSDPAPQIIAGLRNLAISRRQGEIELVATRSVCDAIIKSPKLNADETAIYRRVRENSAQLIHMVSNSAVYVVIAPSNSQPGVEMNADTRIITIPISMIASCIELCLKPILLCENLDDCKFMHFVADVYSYNQNYPTRKLQFHQHNGGGSTTADVYSTIVSNEEL